MNRTSITDLIPNIDPKTARSVDEIFAGAGITDPQAASLMRAVVLGYNAGGNNESLRNTQLEQQLLEKINGQIDAAALAENVHAGIYYGYDVTAAVDQFLNDFDINPAAYLARHPDIADTLVAAGIELTTFTTIDDWTTSRCLLHYTAVARTVHLIGELDHVRPGPDLTAWDRDPFAHLFGITNRITAALRNGAALLRLGAPEGEPQWWVGIGTVQHPDLVVSHFKRREYADEPDAITATAHKGDASV